MVKINSLKYNPITVDTVLKIRRKRKMFDINNVKITVLRMPNEGDWMACKRRALITVGKEPVNPPDDKWKKDILRARHSPIRRLEFSILIENLPSSISVHFVRHVHAQPYVKSQRNDRQSEYDRDNAPQSAPVAMIWDFNAEEAQVIFNKRLCAQADKNTRAVAAKIRDAILAEDNIYREVFVPFCEFYGCCKEMKPCGRETTYDLLMREKAEIFNERNKLKKEVEQLKTDVKNLKDLAVLNENVIHTIKTGVEDVIGHRHEKPMNEYTEVYVVRIVKEAVEKLKNKIEDLFDEQYSLNEMIDDLKTSKINQLSEILDLKKKLENSNIVDEILIEKTRKLLDMLKTKPKGILIFDMDKVSNWTFNPGREVDGIKLAYDEFVIQTNESPYAFDKDDIEKVLEADDTKKHNDGYISYLMAFKAYNAKKRLNAMYGTTCCHTYFEKDMSKFKSPTGLKAIVTPVETISDDEKCCDNCRWGNLEPNPYFYPCTKCEASEPSNWEPKKGGEEV